MGTTLRTVASVTIPSMIFYAMNRDDEDYRDAPRWLKDSFWLVPTKGTPIADETPFIRIPKPHLPGILFGSAIERTMDWITDKDPKAFDDFYASIEGASLPGTRIIPDAPLPVPIPTLAVPFIEWFANRSLFRGRDIVPRALEGLPAQYQFQPWTSEFAKHTSAMLSRAGIEAPAIKIENAFFSLTAGTGRLAAKLSDPLLRSRDEPERPEGTLADMPIIRAFAVRPGGGSESEQRLYDRFDELERKRAAINYARRYKRFTPEPMEPGELAQYARLKGARKRMGNLMRRSRDIESSGMSPAVKRERMHDLARRRTSIARAAMGGTR